MDVGDSRWGNYVPWFLRYTADTFSTGNWRTCFSRFSQRFGRLFLFNEAGILNLSHFGARLESETLQRFRHSMSAVLDDQIAKFFDPSLIDALAEYRCSTDLEEKVAAAERARRNAGQPPLRRGKNDSAMLRAQQTRSERLEKHFRQIALERLGVAEVILRLLPSEAQILDSLVDDLRKYFAESGIPFTIRGTPPLIVPLEEPLLENGVMQKLLPTLEAKFPNRAHELITVYHETLAGTKSMDSVFGEGFKTLEELARTITGDRNFLFDKNNLNKYFPQIHSATRHTIISLAGQRGDVAAHGRAAPGPHEIRYLLFAICNIALLLIEQPIGTCEGN